MIAVRFAPEALSELTEAAGWYGSRQAGLGRDLLEEVECLLPLIERFPSSFARLQSITSDLTIRRALLPRFPYALVFMELRDHVRILAVAHVKREPRYWLTRAEES